MSAQIPEIGPGKSIIVTTPSGDEADEIVRIAGRTSSAGTWLVETKRHRHVVVVLGKDGKLSARVVLT